MKHDIVSACARPVVGLLAAVVAVGGAVATAPPARADTYAPGVSSSTIWDNSTPLVDGRGQRVEGLRGNAQGSNGVSTVKFGPLGDAVVAEKSGRIAYFSSASARSGSLLTDSSGRDLSADTLAVGDTGLGGVALDPAWPLRPYVYAFYLNNKKHPEQGTGRWANTDCPSDGTCIVDGTIERLTIGNRIAGGRLVKQITQRRVLVDRGWCQGARTHSIGDLEFAPDGSLYAAAGDGTPEYGGNPTQSRLCADQVPIAYPSQMAPLDALDPRGPVSLNGKIIRISPSTGRGVPGNPWFSSGDANRRRIVAMGLRNPYRMAFKPFSSTLAVSVVGQSAIEGVYEFLRLARTVTNVGWPCWEGDQRFASGPLCAGLSPEAGTIVTPTIQWRHGANLVPGEPCPAGGPTSSMGVTYGGLLTPGRFRNALFFNDFARGCMWYRPSGSGGPQFLANFDRRSVRTLTTGPLDRIYFTDYRNGSVRRLNLA